MFHGVNLLAGETLDNLASKLAEIIRTYMGVRRQIVIVGAKRLPVTKGEASIKPPILVTFQNYHDREIIIRRADMLQTTGMQVRWYLPLSLPQLRINLVGLQ